MVNIQNLMNMMTGYERETKPYKTRACKAHCPAQLCHGCGQSVDNG